jgi:hypothetical protein
VEQEMNKRIIATLKNLTSLKTFQEIEKERDPHGTKHCLTLVCAVCGNVHTCRCSMPKQKVEAICDNCSIKIRDKK